MDNARWQVLSGLLDEALALDAPARAAWLAVQRAREPALAAQLERMLRHAQDAPDPHDRHDPAGGDASAAAAIDERTQPAGTQFDRWLQQALGDGREGEAALVGHRFGAWELLRKIGEGGMGQVWLARRADGLYEAQAAIKLLRSDLPPASLAARFARERAVLARLNHPAIARLLDAGIAEGRAFLVLEYVQGRALADHVRAACPTVAQRVRLLIGIAEAVEHAHAQLIVHRDLKPGNVLVTPKGVPKLLDFGIAGVLDEAGQAGDAQLTRQAGRVMTPAYAAPEQVSGAPIGIAADVFALGVMLFELLSGELPFAPHDTDRAVIENALLHQEARRLTHTRAASGAATAAHGGAAAAADDGIPPPLDFARVRGDLEAIVAKALRKPPTERYGSVRALILDLERWLGHRPVSVRRDDLRHRSALWLRRNAVLAVAGGGITLALLAGLAASTWQWRRAEAAARQSDQVTRYLGDLLASASPERHGGQWPTVLQLLETSRREVGERFADDPETLLQLQAVIGETYRRLSRFDVALPLAEQRLALAIGRYGRDDDRSLRAELDLVAALSGQGAFDKVIARLEPLREVVPARFGRLSPEHRTLLHALAYAYARTGRLAEADGLQAEHGRVTEAMYPPGSLERVMHLNALNVLRTQQGRYREALALLKQTLPYWSTLPASAQDEVLTLRRNLIAAQIRLCDYDQLEPRAMALLHDIDRLLGPGNDKAAGLRAELARYYTETGQFARAAAQREANLAAAEAAAVTHPGLRLPARALLLPAQALAASVPPAALLQQARALLAEADLVADQIGFRRGEIWVALARLGLMLQDDALARDALARMRRDSGLNPQRNPDVATRLAQLEAQRARAAGDYAASAQGLQRRLERLLAAPEPASPLAWSTALDLAYTRVLVRDPGAADALARATQLRPPGMPAGVALDKVQAYLQALHDAQGQEQAEAVRAARRALDAAYGRDPAHPRDLRASLGGAFL